LSNKVCLPEENKSNGAGVAVGVVFAILAVVGIAIGVFIYMKKTGKSFSFTKKK